jgi:nucleoside-diphosphate-sugar epimerase
MNPPRALVAGCGDIGGRLAARLLDEGWFVHGLRRDTRKLGAGILPVAGDLQAARMPAEWPAQPLDYLVYCAAANSHDEAGYRAAYIEGLQNVLGWLKQAGQQPRRILFVSSSSVYGQSTGEWVDETSPVEPTGFSGQLMLQAEQVAHASGLPATVVRLTGIYGPGRERFVSQVRGGYRVARQPPLYGNRIHADDAAGLLAFLLQADLAGQPLQACYIGVDNAPAPLDEVVDWLRERLGITRWSDSQSVRRTGSKRCSNARARALGWAPQYPSYREGYGQLLAQ